MASDFTLTTILIVVLGSVWCEQRPFLRYSNYLKKALPYHWQYDQEKLGKSVDKITRWHQVEELRNDQYHGELRPHLSPLRPRPDSFQQWKKWAKQGILAAVVGNKDKELLKVRAQLLQEKLSPNHHVFKKTEVHPQEKPKFKAKEKRFKRHIRAAVINKLEDFEKEPLSGSILRPKRQVVINPQLQPETVMQPHIQIAIPPEPNDKQKNEFPDKRGKRQILYIINRPSQLLYRSPRTTPNPFIRETNIGDYDIGRQDLEGSLPDLGSSRLDSYPLINETQNVLSEFTKKLLSMEKFLQSNECNQSKIWYSQMLLEKVSRKKRSPKMSKLKKKQKVEKKKRKKKKQQKLTPRQIKHYRRIREHKEERRKILHKKLKEKRRLRHKKFGTGPYNNTIVDYYGVYFDSSSSQLNDSLYDSIYDTSEIDSDAVYEENRKEYYKDYPVTEEDSQDSEDEESEESDKTGGENSKNNSEQQNDERKDYHGSKKSIETTNKENVIKNKEKRKCQNYLANTINTRDMLLSTTNHKENMLNNYKSHNSINPKKIESSLNAQTGFKIKTEKLCTPAKKTNTLQKTQIVQYDSKNRVYTDSDKNVKDRKQVLNTFSKKITDTNYNSRPDIVRILFDYEPFNPYENMTVSKELILSHSTTNYQAKLNLMNTILDYYPRHYIH